MSGPSFDHTAMDKILQWDRVFHSAVVNAAASLASAEGAHVVTGKHVENALAVISAGTAAINEASTPHAAGKGQPSRVVESRSTAVAVVHKAAAPSAAPTPVPSARHRPAPGAPRKHGKSPREKATADAQALAKAIADEAE
jgi:hypothetical protein